MAVAAVRGCVFAWCMCVCVYAYECVWLAGRQAGSGMMEDDVLRRGRVSWNLESSVVEDKGSCLRRKQNHSLQQTALAPCSRQYQYRALAKRRICGEEGARVGRFGKAR